ncbi:PREDICTED: uncharacterized protein LOC106117658 isoform X1 [Papilio xuthus]|uniref:Uncharacterized protein LOC106117658 isoform X1 n=1 Tax=Papilio xuthus TaxID=66420 RepID=A0AAJ7E8X4_PAPXU|nr:PREDICTED: uncharacterized protein LOC106117658 isoform X1 [Papilio xuthus]
MSPQNEFNFHVIELLEHSNIHLEKYVCVPNSRIFLRETSDGPVLVHFPANEEIPEINTYFEKKEFSGNLPLHLGNIKYSTMSFEDAINYTKILNIMFDEEQSSTEIVENVSSTSKKKVFESQSTSGGRKMSKQNQFKFHVIEILEPSNIVVEKYVCVPNSWIILRKTSDGPVLVHFPGNEKLPEIKKCIAKQEFSGNLKLYLANLKYSTMSYEDAVNYIKILNIIFDEEQSSTEIVENVPSTSNKEVFESQSSSETNKVSTISTLNSDAKAVLKEITEIPDLIKAEGRINQSKSKIEVADSSPKARRCSKNSHGISLSSNNTINLPDPTTKENLPKTSHCVKDKTNNNQENDPSANNSSMLVTKYQNIMALESILGDNYEEKLEQLQEAFDNKQLFFKEKQDSFMKHSNITKQFIDLINEAKNSSDISDLDSAVREIENCAMELDINKNDVNLLHHTISGSKNDSGKTGEMEHSVGNSDGTEVENINPLKVNSQARNFILPPEYDPNDSRWTLKYQEKEIGLVELLPASRVYVNKIQLRHCIITSWDHNALARKLLFLIFSENALTICSLPGVKSKIYSGATIIRPGLDEHALNVLLNYIQMHAAEQKWRKFDSNLIIKSIRGKLYDIRSKRQNIGN